MNMCGFHLVFLVKICENSTLCSNFNSFYNAQNLTKTYSSKSKGENYFLQKYLSAYETYLRQYGLIQQQYICANNFARGVMNRCFGRMTQNKRYYITVHVLVERHKIKDSTSLYMFGRKTK